MSHDRILLAHGGGGDLTRQLIDGLIVAKLGNPTLNALTDAAVLARPDGRICLTTDASVVQPLFFPGGDIGRLAVAGTVNDLAVMGADPIALCQTLIIEEGLELAVLARVLDSVAATAAEAGVQIVAGDTKVVERRGGDGLFLSTAGIGVLPAGVDLGLHRIQAGDVILVSGRIADHGLAIMSVREGLGFESELTSDVAPLADLCAALRDLGEDLRFLRDPTRGGIAGVMADLVIGTGHGVELEERTIPMGGCARNAAEMLGLDPLAVANEGKVVAVVAAAAADRALGICQANPKGVHATAIGRVVAADRPLVELITTAGGRRIVQRPYGEELPRIC